jgi:inosine/xanthosine triphosphatase
MEKIIVAVGSTRRPKLNAVWEALSVVGPSLDANSQFEIASREAPSGVRHTPLTRADIMAGARNRAEALVKLAREEKQAWRFFVGLEGGLDAIEQGGARWVFLENWAYVADASGRGSFGRSGGVLLPEALVRQVVDEGIELGIAIDEFAGGHGIRDAQGAWGVLTCNLVTRQDAFRLAVISAFAPFFNSSLYRPPEHAK